MALAERDIKMLKILGIAIVVAAVYWVYTEILPAYDNLLIELDKVKKTVDEGRNKEKFLPKLEYEVKVLQAKLKEKEKRLPPRDIGLKLLTKLEQLGERINIKFDKLAFGAETDLGLYKSLSIEIYPTDLDGGGLPLQKVYLLLNALNNFENLLDIVNFNFAPIDEKKERFRVQLVANVYMFQQEKFEKEFK
ncbi:MAG TPA: type 4a pilus biogenesis protein PilO [bacterium]|nr:type 4a pilus biogenesis protein PilO [bacterium]HOL48170.1 type 4a pilus biogenesis protein PilO [bacterium]HPQ18004.1 type 4a pilus biogenesis protein PilO [bacterium]